MLYGIRVVVHRFAACVDVCDGPEAIRWQKHNEVIWREFKRSLTIDVVEDRCVFDKRHVAQVLRHTPGRHRHDTHAQSFKHNSQIYILRKSIKCIRITCWIQNIMLTHWHDYRRTENMSSLVSLWFYSKVDRSFQAQYLLKGLFVPMQPVSR